MELNLLISIMRWGVDVTVVEYLPNIVPVEDIDVSKQLEKTFKKKGMNIMTNSSVEKVEKSSKGCEVHVKTKKGIETLNCDVVLSAVGIQPQLRHTPPSDSFSITAVFIPSCEALIAVTYPPGPLPKTITS